jgi:hypothetical protein
MSRNVPKQISEVADWSTPLDLPAGPRFMHVVSFCQENTARYWEGAMSCRAPRYAQGVAGAPGYIQLIDLEKFGAERNSAPWFLVTPEWNKRILGRVDDFVFESPEVKKHITEVADWSKTYDLPELPFRLHKFLFCEKRARDAPKTDTGLLQRVVCAGLRRQAGIPPVRRRGSHPDWRLSIPGFAPPPNGIAN